MFKWLIKLFRSKPVAEFSSLNSSQPNIPLNPSSNAYGLSGLTNPDNILSGTNRGTQFVGSTSLQVDSTQNLITVKGGTNNANNVLRFGQVSAGFLGMAVNNGTFDTMFAGQDSSGNTVVKIASNGIDVKTATNDQLVFNSAQDIFKVVKTGTATINPPSSMASGQIITNTIPHGLSVTPAFQVYVNNPAFSIGGYSSGGITNLPSPLYFINGTGTAGVLYNQQARADSTNLYIDFIMLNATSFSGLNAYTWTYKYYILQETAS